MKIVRNIGIGIATILGLRYLYNTSQETKAFDYFFAGINFKKAHWGLLNTYFDLELVMKIINPSNFTITIDELFLQVYLKDTKIGELIQNNLIATIEQKDVSFVKLPFSTENLISLILDKTIREQVLAKKIPDKLHITGTVKVRGVSKYIDEYLELFEPEKNLKGLSGFFDLNQIKTLDELKKQYRRLALKYHPDKGGDTALMQELNNEYDRLFKQFMTNSGFTEAQQATETQINEIYKEIISKIINYDGLIIEIVGKWIWVSGNTYFVRKELKEAGFKFAPNKKMWFWRPDEYASSNRSPLEMNEIRKIYGSETVDRDEYEIRKRQHLRGLNTLTDNLKALQILLTLR